MTDEPPTHGSDHDPTTSGTRRTVRSARVAVPGLTCRDDESQLRERLLRVDGVSGVAAQSSTRTVDVSYDPDRTSDEAVRERIADAGYAVDRDRTAGRARSPRRRRGEDRARTDGRRRGEPQRRRRHGGDGCRCRRCRNGRPKGDGSAGTGRSR